MKAIFYKLVNPIDKHSWWKREVEIKSFEHFQEECLSIVWTNRTQRFCYLCDIEKSDDKKMVIKCEELIKQDNLADIYYLVEKMYQVGECARESGGKYRNGLLLKFKIFIVEFIKEGYSFYKELFQGIYFGIFKCK